MQRIYSNPDAGIVHLLRNELEKRGIESVVRGEHLAAAGVPMEAWGELWVMDEARVAEAAQVVQDFIDRSGATGAEPWTCPKCGEEVDPEFAVCWSCGMEHP